MSRFDLGYVAMLSLLHKNVFIIFCVIIVLFMVWMFPIHIIGGMLIMILFLCNIRRGTASIILSIIIGFTMKCGIPWDGWLCNFYEVYRSENPLCIIFIIYTIVYFFLLTIERTIGKIGFWNVSPFLLFLGLLFIIPLYYFPFCPLILTISAIIIIAIYGIVLSNLRDKHIKRKKVLFFLFLIIVEFTLGMIYSDDYVDNQSRKMINAYANYLSNEKYAYIIETEKEDFRNYEIKLSRKQGSDTICVGYFFVETSPFRINVKEGGWGRKYLIESVPYGKLFHSKKEKTKN